MTPVRTPDVVRGDVPGLLCLGMPIFVLRQTPEDDEAEPCDGERLRLAEQAVVTDHGNDAGWLVATGRTVDTCGPNWSQLHPADVAIDWSARASIYLCLAWLADRGHPGCLWMLPATHGGLVQAWGKLTAWEVSAILVSRSVMRVARGLGPVQAMFLQWQPQEDPATGTHWKREGWPGVELLWVMPRSGWQMMRFPGPPPFKGPETGDAGKLAADRAALADGCALLAPGGILLPD